VEQWISYGNAKVDKWIMREFVVPQAFFDKAKGPDTARITAAIPEIETCCGVLDAALAKSPYLVGDKLTYADMHVLPMVMTLQAWPAGKEIAPKYASLMAWSKRLAERPSYASTAPPPRK
jgi:glutathione S-transferase